MGDELRVTVVATGLGSQDMQAGSPRIAQEVKRSVAGDGVPDYSDFDRPTVIRKAVVNGTDEGHSVPIKIWIILTFQPFFADRLIEGHSRGGISFKFLKIYGGLSMNDFLSKIIG